MAVPPQLAAALPEGPANAIGAMLMAAPGAPWSDQLLQDVLEELGWDDDIDTQFHMQPPRANFGDDVSDIGVIITRRPVRRRGRRDFLLCATVCARPKLDFIDPNTWTWPLRRCSGCKPCTVAALREIIEWAQQKVAMVKRRGGWCVNCDQDEYTRGLGIKRLRVHGQPYCAECFVRRSLVAC